MLRMLIIFYDSRSNFKGRSSIRESGQLYILKKLHHGSSLEVLDYASRSRSKTITMNIHLTTFCKLTIYFVFLFHGPFALAFTCTNVLEIMGQLLRAGVTHCQSTWSNMGRGSGFFFTSFLLRYLYLLPVFWQGRRTENLFLCSHLPAKPPADQKWLGANS